MSKARKPRIITETVQRLRALAKDVREFGVVDDERHARVIDNIATGLDAHDARETRLDPSRRKRKVRRA
jgi:hypothetical protein